MQDFKKLAQAFIETNPQATKTEAEAHAKQVFPDKKDVIAFMTMWSMLLKIRR